MDKNWLVPLRGDTEGGEKALESGRCGANIDWWCDLGHPSQTQSHGS